MLCLPQREANTESEEWRGNARHSKMSKIHTLGLCIHYTRAELRRKTHFNINGRQAGESVCVFISAFEHISFFLAPWKYPAETLGREVLGSQDVNVNFLPVAMKTLSQRAPVPPPPPSSSPHPPWSPHFQSKKPFCLQSSLCNQTLRNISTSGSPVDRETPNIWGLY